MMRFRTIKDALKTTLADNAAGNFIVIGHQRQKKSGTTINANRLVQVYYSQGDFPKSGGSYTGQKAHEMIFNIDLTVSSKAKGDLATLSNPASTALQRAAALAGIQEATAEADYDIDELIELVFQILMDSQNIDLGLGKNVFSDRWITTVKKDSIIDEGGHAIKTAGLQYTCKTNEDVLGVTGTTPASVTYDSTMDIDGDDVEKTGVSVTNT